MTHKEALAWCQESLAIVSFIYVQGASRVRVRPCGFPFLETERDTFIEAVEATKNNVDRCMQSMKVSQEASEHELRVMAQFRSERKNVDQQ